MSSKPTAVLLISCPDQRGLVAHAVRLHLEHRVLPYGIKTVVFD